MVWNQCPKAKVCVCRRSIRMESVNHGVPFHCSKYKISLSELIQWLFDVLFPFFMGSGIDFLQMLRLREANFQFSKAKFLVFGPSSSPTLEVLEVSRTKRDLILTMKHRLVLVMVSTVVHSHSGESMAIYALTRRSWMCAVGAGLSGRFKLRTESRGT